MKKMILAMMVAGTLGCVAARAVEVDNMDADIRAVFSKMQSMSHGYYTQDEWNNLTQQMDTIAKRAEDAKAWDQLVEMNRVKAMALGQMRRDPQSAITVLRGTLDKFGAKCPPRMGRFYAMLADNYAQLGKEEEISKLIKEFEQGPYYTTEQYSFSGGQGRLQELTVTRPAAKGAASIIVTMMERARHKAVFGPGKLFPDMTCTDLQGRPLKLSDLRGKVVAVDFFARGFALYPRLLKQLTTAWQLYQKNGLEIVSINIEAGVTPEELATFARAQNMGWTVVDGNADLARKLALFGDPSIFLLDRNGVITARDVTEDNLVQSIKDALGVR
ncbi:MAG: redoxin domain-containing protein [Kiritimatiellaeota bacterium]|nr:redoxin domain-containing protein [Kiritimatiellota bacterium]